jgi:preprotein translocase subunit YajC|tara:strand:+ start:476 stop:883 length:408 start_codon:yes stop_codon:yes gene_type:complete
LHVSLAKWVALNRVSGSFATILMTLIDNITWVLAAQTATGTGQQGPVWMQFVPFVFLFLIMYVILIRPQQKKAREHDALLKQLKIGDRVSTNGGIIGVVVGLKDNKVSIRSADTKLEMLKGAITEVLKDKSSSES